MKHYPGGIGDLAQRAVEEAEAALAPPAEILAKTFGLLRIERTTFHADSIAYVYERHQTPFGERCIAWRITDHPKPSAPDRYDPSKPLPADRNLQLRPQVERRVEVSCNDPRMTRVTPGSIGTPVPRHG
jgi:hypothetical protein